MTDDAVGQKIVEEQVIGPQTVPPRSAPVGFKPRDTGVEMVGVAERVISKQIVFQAPSAAGFLHRKQRDGVNGRPSSKLPSAKPHRLGHHTPIITPRACTT